MNSKYCVSIYYIIHIIHIIVIFQEAFSLSLSFLKTYYSRLITRKLNTYIIVVFSSSGDVIKLKFNNEVEMIDYTDYACHTFFGYFLLMQTRNLWIDEWISCQARIKMLRTCFRQHFIFNHVLFYVYSTVQL